MSENQLELIPGSIQGADPLDALFEVPEGKEPFAVKEQEHALWCERQITRAENRIQTNQLLYKKALQKLDEWLARANREPEETVNRMMALLKPFVEIAVASGKKQSVDLLEHRVGFRKGQGTVDVKDEDAAVFALEEMGRTDCIDVKKSVKKREVGKLLDEGVVVDGVSKSDGQRTYYIKPLEGGE